MQFFHVSSRGVAHYYTVRYAPPYVETRTDMLIRVGEECVDAGDTATYVRNTPSGEQEISVFVCDEALRRPSVYRMAGNVRIGWGLQLNGHAQAGQILAEAVGHLLPPGSYLWNHFLITLHDGSVLDCGEHAHRGECMMSMANDYRDITHCGTGLPGVQNAALVELPAFPGRVFVQALKRISMMEILVYYGDAVGSLRTQVPV
jgi:hypothetical protein